MLFRTRDLLVRQRTQTINALRGHLAEFGIFAAQGPARVEVLTKAVEDETTPLPEMARDLRDSSPRHCAIDEHVRQRARLRRLGRADPATALDRRQSPFGQYVEDGSARHPALADHRASAVVTWAARKGPRPGNWLARMIARKPHMLVVVVALANKMARMIWAVTTRETLYKDSVAA
jgi:transposase